jgi:hypothetical protein
MREQMKNKEIVGKCPICNRDMIKGRTINEHHLIPKCEKGKDTITLHVICHSKIHSIWTENELRDYYNTIERILSDNSINDFKKWIKNKEPEYVNSNKSSNNKKNKRKR